MYALISSLCLFQSTRPVWGATISRLVSIRLSKFQSTRPVWGATFCPRALGVTAAFQSTRPVWGATSTARSCAARICISIHAPRVGRDLYFALIAFIYANFNPRAPCGARPDCICVDVRVSLISIHAPRVGRDKYAKCAVKYKDISIHAPRVGRDHQGRC